MPTSRLTISGDVGGIAVNSTLSVTADGQIGHNPSLPVAQAGTLSTRTSDTVGTLTLGASHGITDGDVIDIYWADGMCYGATVGTVSGTSVPFTGASGDVLPAQDTAVTAAVQVVIDTDFDGDLLEAIGVQCNARGRLAFMDSGDSLLLGLDLAANDLWHWLSSGTAANPLAGDTVAYLVASQAGVSIAATLKVGILYNSVS